MNWQGNKRSTRNTEHEVEGAQYCVYFLSHRLNWSKELCQQFGDWVYQKYQSGDSQQVAFSDGFREMAYIIAKTRSSKNGTTNLI